MNQPRTEFCATTVLEHTIARIRRVPTQHEDCGAAAYCSSILFSGSPLQYIQRPVSLPHQNRALTAAATNRKHGNEKRVHSQSVCANYFLLLMHLLHFRAGKQLEPSQQLVAHEPHDEAAVRGAAAASQQLKEPDDQRARRSAPRQIRGSCTPSTA